MVRNGLAGTPKFPTRNEVALDTPTITLNQICSADLTRAALKTEPEETAHIWKTPDEMSGRWRFDDLFVPQLGDRRASLSAAKIVRIARTFDAGHFFGIRFERMAGRRHCNLLGQPGELEPDQIEHQRRLFLPRQHVGGARP